MDPTAQTPPSEVPSRAALAEHLLARLQDGGWRAPDVLLVGGPAGPVVVKARIRPSGPPDSTTRS